MNRGLLKKILPHLIAVLVFLVVAIIYCSPALQGKTVQQNDVIHWNAANQQSLAYKEANGHYPLWTNALFSGMPTFMIAYEPGNDLPWFFHKVITLGLPTPIQFFFLACICFYFLSQVLRVRPLVGVLGALAFAYATYNPVIISVGHDTKMWSIAYMPAVTASVLLIFQKRYLSGAALTAMFVGIIVAMNHLQIDYYLMLSLVLMGLGFMVSWIRQKDYKHIGAVIGLTLIAALVGVGTNYTSISSTYDYQKYTIRGGASPLAEVDENNKQNGLDKEYAFSYSMKQSEPLVLMFPHMYGGSNEKQEMDPEKSSTIRVLRSFPQQLQQQLPVIYYWGGLTETGIGTSGPPYSGVVICFLAILGIFLIENKYKWWLIAGTVLSIFLAMGSFFDGFNTFLYEHLPFYNKFRAPSMALVIANFLLPVMAMLSLEQIVSRWNDPKLLPQLKKGLYATAGVFGLMLLLYFNFEYMGRMDHQILQSVQSMNQPQLLELIQQYINALKEDRQSMLMTDITKGLVYVLLALAIIYLIIKNKIQVKYGIIAMTILVFIDLMMVDVRYLNKENYVPKANIDIPLSNVNRQIQQDTSYYRVLNLAGNTYNENYTSAHHNSVGGYSAAKLLIYQDLIEQQLSRNINPTVVNMLNAKYVIQPDQQTGQPRVTANPGAAGPAWIARQIEFADSPKAAMAALTNLEDAGTVIAYEKDRSQINTPQLTDSTASIRLINNDNDYILYESNTQQPQFAVLSEIYYPGGWKAFVDGQETPIFNVNYALRGINLPAGNHKIELKFEPQSYYGSKTLTTTATVLTLILMLGAIFGEWKRNKNHTKA
jgi:hypothetical protein